MSSAATTAVASPPNATTTPAGMPQTMNATVTAFGDQPRRANTQVASGGTLRMYSRPAQCPSFSRSSTAWRWPRARSSARDGPDILLHSLGDLRLGKGEAFEDRVPAGPGARRMRDRPGEIRAGQADIARAAGQPMTAQTLRYRRELPGVLAQVRAEQGSQASQLPVARRTRIELIDRVHDLVVTAAARAAGSGYGHGHPGQDQRLGEHREELIRAFRARLQEHGLSSGPGHGDGQPVDPLAGVSGRQLPVRHRGQGAYHIADPGDRRDHAV